jgi:site-specific DNA-cytosine methylase
MTKTNSPKKTGKLGTMFPTPTKRDYKDTGGEKTDWAKIAKKSRLAGAVRAFPTPRAFMYKDGETDRGKSNLGEVVGGQLNPDWVEWLMGYPLYWTSLERENKQAVPDAYWDAEPKDIPRVVAGTRDRTNRLKGLGNAIVPQVAALIMERIKNA